MSLEFGVKMGPGSRSPRIYPNAQRRKSLALVISPSRITLNEQTMYAYAEVWERVRLVCTVRKCE
jgi:hypothetical protein